MSAQKLFEQYKETYLEAYKDANGHELEGGIRFENGWVYIGNSVFSTKCRAKELPIIIKNLQKKAQDDKNKKPDYPTYNIKTKFNLKFNEKNNWTEALLGKIKIGYYTKTVDENMDNIFFVWSYLPIQPKMLLNSEEDAINELIVIAQEYVNMLNK